MEADKPVRQKRQRKPRAASTAEAPAHAASQQASMSPLLVAHSPAPTAYSPMSQASTLGSGTMPGPAPATSGFSSGSPPSYYMSAQTHSDVPSIYSPQLFPQNAIPSTSNLQQQPNLNLDPQSCHPSAAIQTQAQAQGSMQGRLRVNTATYAPWSLSAVTTGGAGYFPPPLMVYSTSVGSTSQNSNESSSSCSASTQRSSDPGTPPPAPLKRKRETPEEGLRATQRLTVARKQKQAKEHRQEKEQTQAKRLEAENALKSLLRLPQ